MSKDEVALMQQVHDEHADVLWRFCLSLVGNDRGRAEDVAQETLLRAWRHGTILASSPAAVRSWLFTVARNIVIDDWRSRRAKPGPVADVSSSRSRKTLKMSRKMLAAIARALSPLARRTRLKSKRTWRR